MPNQDKKAATYRLTVETLKTVDRLARERGLTKAGIIQEAVRFYANFNWKNVTVEVGRGK